MSTPDALQASEFDELDAILDSLRTRHDDTPQWEFCEGFLAALVCCRRPIPADEYLSVLLPSDDEPGPHGPFESAEQAERFMALWTRRQAEVLAALDADVQQLDDPRAYAPDVLDVRGGMASLPEEERLAAEDGPLPSFAQVWALGFMFAVENWPDDWAAPRDKEAAEILDSALEALVAMTEDDTEPPSISMFSEDGPASVSQARLDAYGTALWAVYELRELWRSLGPRVEQVRKVAGPGRNDPCPCGSGKKFKKCHGA